MHNGHAPTLLPDYDVAVGFFFFFFPSLSCAGSHQRSGDIVKHAKRAVNHIGHFFFFFPSPPSECVDCYVVVFGFK